MPEIGQKKKAVSDVVFSFISLIILTGVQQLVVFPLLAKYHSIENYGLILSVTGVISIATSTIGNTMNNVQLLYDNKKEKKDFSDYRIWLSIVALSISPIIVVVLVLAYDLSIPFSIPVLILIIMGIYRAYYLVYFRIALDFKRQLLSNVFLVAGYLVGLLIFAKTDYWFALFLIGEFASFTYVYIRANKLKRKSKLKFTENKKDIGILYFQLILGSLMGNGLVYFDRLMLHPLIGATFVSIFTVASFWGKSISLVIEPMATVLLSYLSKYAKKITIKIFTTLILVNIVFCGFMFLIGIWLAPFVSRLLYPSIIDEALSYINLANLALITGACCSLIRPINLVICKQNMLNLIQAVQLVLYIVLSIILVPIGGLKAFCIVTIIKNVLGACLQILYGALKLRKKTFNEET